MYYSYMPVLFFGAFQFLVMDLSAPWLYANLILAVLFILLFLGVTVYLSYLAFKFQKDPASIPPEYAFLAMEPTSVLELPMRLIRRLLLAAVLVPTVYTVQIFGLLAVNATFLVLLIYVQNSGLNRQRYKMAQAELGWTYTEYLINKVLIRCIEVAIIIYEVMIFALNKGESTYFIVGAMLPLAVTAIWLVWRAWLALRRMLVPYFPWLAATDD
jgi:hypothetical protein